MSAAGCFRRKGRTSVWSAACPEGWLEGECEIVGSRGGYFPMAVEPKTRAHVVIPKELLEEVDGLVGSRRRSEFIVDAVRRQVQRARLGAAIESTAGILDPADYPEWETREKISAWVHESRDADRRPFEREPNDG